MFSLRPSRDRGHADHGWLKSQHSFSFADYVDPAHMGFGNLRVINEDRISPGTGFGMHSHRDMEIISIVLSGALAHKDSMGHVEVIRPGEVQRMSAGRGVAHSEFNHDQAGVTHFLQIWLLPSQLAIEPGYEQRSFDPAQQRGRLALVVAPVGDAVHQGQGAVAIRPLSIHADARLYRGQFDGAESHELPLQPGRLAYVQVIDGSLDVNGHRLGAGDALRVEAEAVLKLSGGVNSDLIVFDLAPRPS